MADFHLKQSDTAPAIEAILEDENGDAVDLSNATNVDFHMRDKSDQSTVTDTSASITDAAAGKVKYDWQASDTSSTGTFEAEFEVTFSNGDIETFPNTEHLEILITEQIA